MLGERQEEEILTKFGERLREGVWKGHETRSAISCWYLVASIYGALTFQRYKLFLD